MKFNIKVTQDHIDNGEKENGYTCAISLAFISMPNIVHIPYSTPVVGEEEGIACFETTDGTEYRAVLPINATEFYQAFDEGNLVHPIEFEIDADVVGPEPTDDNSVYLGD